MAWKLILSTLIFQLFLSCLVNGQDQKKATSVDFYTNAAWGAHVIMRVELSSLFLPLPHNHFRTLAPATLNAFDAYVRHLSQQKKDEKLNKKWAKLYDYRLGVEIHYSDSSTVYIACGEKPYVDFNGDIFKDKGYTFLILLNSQFDLPVIREFLIKEKVIK